MKDFINKEVTLHLGTVPGFTDSVKGKVLEVTDMAIIVETKSSFETVFLSAIKRISVKK